MHTSSLHGKLDALYVAITQRKVSWLLDADIRGFFDTLNHGWLMKFVEHRLADPRVLRLIRKFLRAGGSEDGQWSKTEVGTPRFTHCCSKRRSVGGFTLRWKTIAKIMRAKLKKVRQDLRCKI